VVKRVTTEEFVAKAHKVHGGAYSYDKAVYETNKSVVTVTCPKHGDYNVTAVVHLLGFKCRKCSNEGKRGKRFKPLVPGSIARQEARSQGKMFYYGTACRKCNETFRYVSNNACHKCSREARVISNAKNIPIRLSRVAQANICKSDEKIQQHIRDIYSCTKKMAKQFKVNLHVDPTLL
jgi:hypothetical protein